MNSLIAPIICFIILIYCYFRFSKGNDIKLEFSTNPPNNLDSLEIAFLLRGFITDNDIVSLLLSLANTGYISFNGNKDYFTIKKEKEKNKSILYSTHYMEEAEALADRVGIMKSGSLITVGTPAEIKEEAGTEKFEDAFIALVKGAKK